MFKLEDAYHFTRLVTASAPLPGGGAMTGEFTVAFRVIPRSEVVAIFERGGDTDAALLRYALVGWEGVQDPQGNPMPFSEENRDRLLEIPFIAAAICKAYFAGIQHFSENVAPEAPRQLM